MSWSSDGIWKGSGKVDYNTKYKPSFKEEIVELGKLGRTKCQMAVSLGVCRATLGHWVNPKHPQYKEDFAAAYQLARSYSQANYEELAIMAAAGKVPNHSSATFKLMMMGNFPASYPGMFPERNSVLDDPDELEKDVAAITEDTKAKDAGLAYGEKLKELSDKSEWDW